MSDTPRTDKLARGNHVVPTEWAEDLERECNEAKHSNGITFLMAEKHALENELEAMTSKAVGWQNQAELNARLLVECREKAERYRLEANAMMAQRDEAKRECTQRKADWNKACDEQGFLMLECDGHRAKAAKLREVLQSVMDWNPKPEYWERPETVARFEADMAKARKVLEEAQETKPHQKWWEVLEETE